MPAPYCVAVKPSQGNQLHNLRERILYFLRKERSDQSCSPYLHNFSAVSFCPTNYAYYNYCINSKPSYRASMVMVVSKPPPPTHTHTQTHTQTYTHSHLKKNPDFLLQPLRVFTVGIAELGQSRHNLLTFLEVSRDGRKPLYLIIQILFYTEQITKHLLLLQLR